MALKVCVNLRCCLTTRDGRSPPPAHTFLKVVRRSQVSGVPRTAGHKAWRPCGDSRENSESQVLLEGTQTMAAEGLPAPDSADPEPGLRDQVFLNILYVVAFNYTLEKFGVMRDSFFL